MLWKYKAILGKAPGVQLVGYVLGERDGGGNVRLPPAQGTMHKHLDGCRQVVHLLVHHPATHHKPCNHAATWQELVEEVHTFKNTVQVQSSLFTRDVNITAEQSRLEQIPLHRRNQYKNKVE
jgi:hypothetical protein